MRFGVQVKVACIFLSLFHALEAHSEVGVVVDASALNVRNENGSILCTIPNGTPVTAIARHADGVRVEVSFDRPPRGCPKVGLVAGNHLAAASREGGEFAVTDVNGLSFRSAPRARRNTLLCSLKKGTRVKVLDEVRLNWLKVELDPEVPGCPEKGFVFQSYLRGVSPFIDLPLIAGTSEDGEKGDVVECCRNKGTAAVKEMEKFSGKLGQSLPEAPTVPKAPVSSGGGSASPYKRPVLVSASMLIVRDKAGNIVCGLPQNTLLGAVARVPGRESMEVVFESPNCPGVKGGYVASKYVRPESGEKASELSIDVDGLSLRGSPEFSSSAWKCSLPKGTKVIGHSDKSVSTGEVNWIHVELKDPPPGCPAQGYLANSYTSTTESYEDLPLVDAIAQVEDLREERQEEGTPPLRGEPRKEAQRPSPKPAPSPSAGPSSPFLSELRKMVKSSRYRPNGIPSNRGLLQLPLIGKRGNIAPCGSHHYNPDSPVGVDAYTNPLTACVLLSVLQDWKRNFCPSGDAGCTIAIGDISHRSRYEFSGHRTHTNGQCVDFRPMRTGSFQDAPLTYRDRNYDQKKMRQFVTLLKKKGATNMFFNDTSLGTSAIQGHENHIHVCFKENSVTRNVCNNLQLDPKVCPELQ